MSRKSESQVSIAFPLPVEDGWPPAGAECLPFEKVDEGYRLLDAPLFVGDLSVNDIIAVELDDEHVAHAWKHVRRSSRTTIWLLCQKDPNDIEQTLRKLRDLGCNTVRLAKFGCYAVDVPELVPMSDVDAVLSSMDSTSVAVAFPSMRHPD